MTLFFYTAFLACHRVLGDGTVTAAHSEDTSHKAPLLVSASRLDRWGALTLRGLLTVQLSSKLCLRPPVATKDSEHFLPQFRSSQLTASRAQPR